MPLPLTETEEAALAFAACGVTGYALADLSYGRGQGGGMLAGLLGRAVASPDAINTDSVFVTHDEATYLLKRPQDFAPDEIPTLVELGRRGELVELYRKCRIKIADGRAAPPVEPGYNFNINRWALYAPGSTYFLPVEEIRRSTSMRCSKPSMSRWRSSSWTSGRTSGRHLTLRPEQRRPPEQRHLIRPHGDHPDDRGFARRSLRPRAGHGAAELGAPEPVPT